MESWRHRVSWVVCLGLVGVGALGAEEGGGDGDICRIGRSQSPIAVATSASQPGSLTTPAPDYAASGVVLWNDGAHSVQAQFAGSAGALGPGDNRLLVDGVYYRLDQLHFHHPGEHPIDGKIFDMELHLVHRDQTGQSLAVLAVPIQVVRELPDNPAIARLWEHLPPVADDRRFLPQPFDPATLLPADRQALRYPGSLTTPPCAETVRWSVFTTPIRISQGQFERYLEVFPKPYARSPQAANGRVPILTQQP